MNKTYLKKVLPFLTKIDADRRQQFENYFRTAPNWLLESLVVEEVEKEKVIFHEGDNVHMICFIGKGMVKVMNNSVHGTSYNHRIFSKVYAYGGMEVLMDISTYSHTLQTLTKCTLVKIPKSKFEKWLQTDIIALKQESKLMGEYLMEQACSSRDFLFLQGANRLAWLFVDWHEKYAKDGVLRVSIVRQDLSDYTGICVRTVNRCLKKFLNDGYISRKNGEIEINQMQYILLKESTEEIFEEAM